MKSVLINLKESLDQKDIEEAEGRARACGMSLDDWLVMMIKSAIRHPETLIPEKFSTDRESDRTPPH